MNNHMVTSPNLCKHCRVDANAYTDSSDRLAFIKALCTYKERTMTDGELIGTYTCPHRLDKPLPKVEKYTFSSAGHAPKYSTTT